MAKPTSKANKPMLSLLGADVRELMAHARDFKTQHPHALIKVVAGLRADGEHVLVRSTKGVWKYPQGKLRVAKLKREGMRLSIV